MKLIRGYTTLFSDWLFYLYDYTQKIILAYMYAYTRTCLTGPLHVIVELPLAEKPGCFQGSRCGYYVLYANMFIVTVHRNETVQGQQL